MIKAYRDIMTKKVIFEKAKTPKIQWHNNIINMYNNPTEDNVADLFLFWEVLNPNP